MVHSLPQCTLFLDLLLTDCTPNHLVLLEEQSSSSFTACCFVYTALLIPCHPWYHKTGKQACPWKPHLLRQGTRQWLILWSLKVSMQSCTLVWLRCNFSHIFHNSILVLHLWPSFCSWGMRGRASAYQADFHLGWISTSKSNWSRNSQPSIRSVFRCFEYTLSPSLKRLQLHQLMNSLQCSVSKRSCSF